MRTQKLCFAAAKLGYYVDGIIS